MGDYDVLYPGIDSENDAAINLLADLASARPEHAVVEFGIGTGRLALGLQERGFRVAGIDGSERMVAKLRSKPGSETIDIVMGDYRDGRVDGQFSVVALVFNGIFDPRGRRVQLDIFRNAALHLGSGGYFVIESWVMSDIQRNGDWSIVPRYVGEEHVEIQLARFDITTNQIERTFVHLRPEGLDFLTVFDTYAAPGELDIMAEVTGFEKVARYASWLRDDFTVASSRSISVYQLRT